MALHKENYTWNIKDNKLVNKMLNAKVGHRFKSDVFTIGDLNWRIRIYPNGKNYGAAGAVEVFVELITLPSSWKSVTIMQSIQSPQTQSGSTTLDTYNKNGHLNGWTVYTLRLDELIKSKYKTLTFIISIDIIRILKENENIFYNIKYPLLKHKTLIWNLDMQTFNACEKANIRQYNRKQITSDIFENMWCIRLYPNGINPMNKGQWIVLELLLYPLNVYAIDIQWNLCIKQLNVNKTLTSTFKIGEPGKIMEIMKAGTFNQFTTQFIKYNKIEIIIDVTVLKTFDKNNTEIEIKSLSKCDNYKQEEKNDNYNKNQKHKKAQQQPQSKSYTNTEIYFEYIKKFNSKPAKAIHLISYAKQIGQSISFRDATNIIKNALNNKILPTNNKTTKQNQTVQKATQQISKKKRYNGQIVNQLVNLGIGSRDQCIGASLSVANPNDINAVGNAVLQRKNIQSKKDNIIAHRDNNVKTKINNISFVESESEIKRLKLEFELKVKDKKLKSKDKKLKEMEQQILYLIKSKEELFTSHNNEIQTILEKWTMSQQNNYNKSDSKTIAMVKQLNDTINKNKGILNQDIQENKNNINKLTQSHYEMKQDLEEAKQSITSLNGRVCTIEQCVSERDVTIAKINNKIDGLLSVPPEEIKLQHDICLLCNNENNELFYKIITEKISMMFFDAKIIISDFVNHEIPIKSKIGKGINIVSKIVEKLANDIPFVSSVIGLVRTGMKITYDICVLQSLAKHVLSFESKFAGDGSKFASQFALIITKKSEGEIENIKNDCRHIRNINKKRKEIKKKIEKICNVYCDNLIKIISSGYGENIFKLCKVNNNGNLYLNIIVQLTIYHPKESMSMVKTDFASVLEKEKLQKVMSGLISTSEAKELISSYFNQFGTPKFMKNIIEAVN